MIFSTQEFWYVTLFCRNTFCSLFSFHGALRFQKGKVKEHASELSRRIQQAQLDPPPALPPTVQSTLIFCLQTCFDLKLPIYTLFYFILRRTEVEITNQREDVQSATGGILEGWTTTGIAFARLSSFTNASRSLSAMRG